MTFCHLRNVRGFFSDYYLGSIFGRGEGRGRKKTVSDRETDFAYRRLLRIYERAEGQAVDASSSRERLIRPLLRDVLGFHLGEGQDRVHPLFASAEDEAAGKPALVAAYCGAWDEDLVGGRGAATPARKLEKFLASSNLSYGMLLTGERIRLVRAPGDGPRGAYLEVDLAGLEAEEDPESFAAFYRLFRAPTFLPAEDGQAPIRRIEAESRKHAEKVSEDIKRAVFTAAETLVGALLQDARAKERLADPSALSDGDLRAYRDAALTALYRILFILYAEARDPRLDEHRIYRDTYSIHGLVEELLRNPARDWPDNRSGIWARLRALSRIYDQGLPAITPWQHIPARGGDFFAADTPQGRILEQATIPDRTVAALLLDLTTTPPHQGVGRERVSFRELDIESLGAVYEGLLEFEPRVAREATLEVRVLGRTFALNPDEVVRLCREKNLKLTGDFVIVVGTNAESLHPEAPTDDEEEDETTEVEGEVEPEENSDAEEEEYTSVKKGAAARLIRRLERGDFYFIPGPGRKGSGSFYTPLPLVQDLVRHALGRLAVGKGVPEIENLRILDPACGSAHFLVEAMRFLGKELHRAYVQEYGGKPPPTFTRGQWENEWQASDEAARAANSEARAWCKRRIAERCLFGVDLNPTAVALAHVALWVESLAGDRPLTYFKHHIRCGNSILGTWLNRLDHPPLPSMRSHGRSTQGDLFANLVRKKVQQAAEIRRLIDRAADEGAVEAETTKELDFKEHQRQKAEEILASARLLFDLRSASAFLPEIWGEWQTLCGLIADLNGLEAYARSRKWWEAFTKVREHERLFHWELEYPEVFLDSGHAGFDAVLGNPPWDKVLPTKHEFYARYDILIRAFKGNDLEQRVRELHEALPQIGEQFRDYRKRTTTIAQVLRRGGDFPLSRGRSQAAHEDVSKYFLDRAARVVREGGCVGLVVPSVVYNGDGCVGIRRFLLHDTKIERFYGFENRKKIFPIHSSYKFVSLVFRKGKPNAHDFEAAFVRHDLSELNDAGPKPWVVRITAEEIKRLSPETLAFLEYRTPRDQEIVHKMYRNRPMLGRPGPGAWGARFVSWRNHEVIYNSSEDKDLWTDPVAKRLHVPSSVLGVEPGDIVETIHRMQDRGFFPVLEGKQIDQYLLGTKAVRWWLSVEQAKVKYGRSPREVPTLVFRDTASNTNERTCIAAVLPDRFVGAHSLSGVILENVQPDAAASVFNSLCFDYVLRMRTVGTHVSFTYLMPMPVPTFDLTNELPRVATLVAWKDGIDHVTQKLELWPPLWSANRAVAEAYGLTANDFEHILSTFPVFARKRQEFFAYLKDRLAEWKVDISKVSRPSYIIPASDRAIPLAAEPVTAYRAGSPRKATGRDRFNQAAVLTYIVREFGRTDIGRVGHDKLVYFAQEHLGVDLGLNFERRAAGPWDPALKHRVEALTVKKGWLEVEEHGGPENLSVFRPGPKVGKALFQAKRKLGRMADPLRDLCEFFNSLNFGGTGLERWATIHKCWKDLIVRGASVTEDALIKEVLTWKGDRPEYSEEALRRAIRGMLTEGLVVLE